MAYIKTEVPDLVVISKGYYKEELKITKRKSHIEFQAGIDGVGQTWIIKKDALRTLLK